MGVLEYDPFAAWERELNAGAAQSLEVEQMRAVAMLDPDVLEHAYRRARETLLGSLPLADFEDCVPQLYEARGRRSGEPLGGGLQFNFGLHGRDVGVRIEAYRSVSGDRIESVPPFDHEQAIPIAQGVKTLGTLRDELGMIALPDLSAAPDDPPRDIVYVPIRTPQDF